MAAHLLSTTECDALLAQRPHWSVQQGKLHRDLQFADFSEAFGFMARVALLAEAMGHHPEWSNVWNRVSIDLVTHDLGGISSLDQQMAEGIDAMAAG